MKLNHKYVRIFEVGLILAGLIVWIWVVVFTGNVYEQLAHLQETAKISDLNRLRDSLEIYYMDTLSYPDAISDVQTEVCNTGSEGPIDQSIDCSNLIDLRVLIPQYIHAIPSLPSDTNNGAGFVAYISENRRVVIRRIE